jgi:UDP-N-acetylmuramate dehydrogenase
MAVCAGGGFLDKSARLAYNESPPMNRPSDFREHVRRCVGRAPLEGVALKDLSHFRIGGPADFYLEAASAAELGAAMRAAREADMPFYVIGGGFNLLFDDAGFRGLILKNAVRSIALLPGGNGIRVSAGTNLDALVSFATAHELEGFEFLAGIPGTVGGAVFGNAGAFGQCIGTFLAKAAVLTVAGDEAALTPGDLEFGYRHSALKLRHHIVLEAEFLLRPGRPEAIRTKIAENLALRSGKHPPRDTAYAGSYFKNPPSLPDGTKRPAGWLLEQVGAKDLAVGGASVYAGHCNFLINARQASARDVLALAAELKKRVKDRFGIELEEEVIFLPAGAGAS